ncbi:anti-sigma factor family protein [Vulgatibacter sp.]|uniref:anti-sigma factor family protein n=1 Tax=Vulgatibacter sp. TaxID=1971226 RepID=UPI0035670993
MSFHGVSCKHCVDLLVDYLEGQLAPEHEKALDDHFMACPPCLDFLDQYRASSRLCRRALETEIPQVMADKLDEFLSKHCK